jgi:CDP-paratose synthetase
LPLSILGYCVKNNTEIFVNADTMVNRYVNEYSLFKRQFNDWLLFHKKNIKVINMAMEHIYGEGASEANFVTFIIKKLLKNEKEIMLTEGEQKRISIG